MDEVKSDIFDKLLTVHKLLVVGVCVVLALVSFFVLAPFLSGADSYQGLQDFLTARLAVAGLFGALATAASTISDVFATFARLFLAASVALSLEKILLLFGGKLAFKFIIPVALLALTIAVWTASRRFAKIAASLVLVGVFAAVGVPVSVAVSQAVHNNIMVAEYETAQSELEQYDGITGKARFLLDISKRGVEYISAQFVNAVVSFVLTALIIPLLTLWLVWKFLKTLF
ncbi:hypothetical protein RsTz2092_03590 [Deferribacterales bacterium RsTz2092]